MKRIFLLLCLSYLFACNYKGGKNATANIAILPSFDMLLMDSVTILNAQHIPIGKPTIFLYFRPDCLNCKEETETLLKNINALKKAHIYFLTGADFEDLKGFYQQYHLDQYNNITVGKDHEHSFAKVFKITSVPFTAVYNSQKGLVKIYSEEAPIEAIIKSI